MKPTYGYLAILAIIAAGCAADKEVVLVKKVTTVVGESKSVELTHPIIQAEVFQTWDTVKVVVGKGVVLETCRNDVEARRITGTANTAVGCLLELPAETEVTLWVDGDARGFEVTKGSPSKWIAIEDSKALH